MLFQPNLRRSPGVRIALAAWSIPLLGWIDYLTGYELGFAPFYFVPIAVAAWYGGYAPGLGAALLCTISWLLADALSGHSYSHPSIYIWNTLIRFASFLTVLALILDRRSLFAREREQALTDSLTGLANRRAFKHALDTEILRSRRHDHPMSIAYLDLDNFKQVNDFAGHDAGDCVLKALASALRSELRQEDMAARLGGDEFAVLWPEMSPQQASTVVHRMHRALLHALQATGYDVSISIGCVACTAVTIERGELLRLADATMYQVKRAGKNSVLIVIHPANAADSTPAAETV